MHYFTALSYTERGNYVTYRNFEFRFAASSAYLNSRLVNNLPTFFTTFTLLTNSSVDSNYRTSILAASTNPSSAYAESMTNKQLLNSVKFDSIASVLQ